jgi:hypothetical protein
VSLGASIVNSATWAAQQRHGVMLASVVMPVTKMQLGGLPEYQGTTLLVCKRVGWCRIRVHTRGLGLSPCEQALAVCLLSTGKTQKAAAPLAEPAQLHVGASSLDLLPAHTSAPPTCFCSSWPLSSNILKMRSPPSPNLQMNIGCKRAPFTQQHQARLIITQLHSKGRRSAACTLQEEQVVFGS